MKRSLAGVVPILCGGVLLATTMLAAFPQWRHTAAIILRSLRQDMPERRAHLIGHWVLDVDSLRESTAPGTAIDLVMAGPESKDLMTFAGAYLHLRDVRYFENWDAWRRRERFHFYRADSAANAVGPPPGPAELVLLMDRSAPRQVTVVDDPK